VTQGTLQFTLLEYKNIKLNQTINTEPYWFQGMMSSNLKTMFSLENVSGVAIGGGWQALIAYINLGCYYVVGVPVGLLLGYKFNFGVKVH